MIEPFPNLESCLKELPNGTLRIETYRQQDNAPVLMSSKFKALTQGKGLMELYSVFPGVEVSFSTFLASKVKFSHESLDEVLEIYYCQQGRLGWEMENGDEIYLGSGDLSVHKASFCAESQMSFPTSYSQAMSLILDLNLLQQKKPFIFQEINLNLSPLNNLLDKNTQLTIANHSDLQYIFAPLTKISKTERLPLLKLKVLEILLFLTNFKGKSSQISAYASFKTEQIKKLHDFLIENLDKRFTIEELAKRFSTNPSSLKEIFKAIYGAPIASYIQNYRIQKAKKLLQESQESIATIAKQVGFQSQGKFSQAFKAQEKLLPSQYRKLMH